MSEEILDKQVENKPLRNEKGQLLPGNTANPNGRPKGKNLKEYVADKFRNMTDEDKEKWLILNKIEGATMWKMAEGNPAIDVTSKGESFAPIPILSNVPKDNSDKEDNESSEED